MRFKKHTQIKDIPNLKPKKKGHKWLMTKISFMIILVLLAIYGINSFIEAHEFRSPIIFQNPIPLKERHILNPVASASAAVIHIKTREEMTDEEYIKYKFKEDGKIAVAVVKAESGMEKKVGMNTNGTIDIGCMQINSIHLKKAKTAIERAELLETFLNCKDAVDWAYDELYIPQGFNPWVAFTSGSYLSML